MKYKRKCLMKGLVFFLIALSVSSFTACLDIGKIDIYLTLDKDDLYAGKARLEFVNIHSTAETEAQQKKEMDDFFRDYKQDVEDIIRAMPLYGYSAELEIKKNSRQML